MNMIDVLACQCNMYLSISLLDYEWAHTNKSINKMNEGKCLKLWLEKLNISSWSW